MSGNALFSPSVCYVSHVAPPQRVPSHTAQRLVYAPWRSVAGSVGQRRSCAALSPRLRMQIPGEKDTFNDN